MARTSTPTAAPIVTDVPFPTALTPAEATTGRTVVMLFDEGGKLYRIDGPRPGTKTPSVNVTREDGRKFFMRVADLQATDRAFPALPDYLPKPGDFVTTDKVRGVAADVPWMVTKLTAAKATIMKLDGSGSYANVPFAALTPAEVTVKIKG